jgi:hypothetical protein
MKIDIKNKFNIGKIIGRGKEKHLRKGDEVSTVSMTDSFSEADGFGAMVHSSAPILRMKDTGKRIEWTKDLLLNCACAILMTSVLALFCMSIDSPMLVLFTLPCFVMYMAIATVGSVKPGPIKWIAAAVILVILIVVAAVWHSTVLGGLSMLINQFYDVAEEAQAYIYDRLPGGDVSETAGEIGLAWIACFFGLVTAVPPAEIRRKVSGLIVILVMLAFAYYGLLPSAICIAVMIAALIMAVSRGNILSLIPVMLVALILFGGVMLADPGESYGISRMDENFRDRFALRSALLETQDPTLQEEMPEFEEEEKLEDDESEEEEYDGEIGAYAAYGIILLALAALGAAGYLMHRRISKRIAANRKGIKSSDTREAVTAMFPYTLRWLKGYGIKQLDPSFASMEHALKKEFSDTYSERFMDMYNIWNEAAYSDHDVTEESRVSMETFVEDTVEAVNKKCTLRDKLRLTLRYAL